MVMMINTYKQKQKYMMVVWLQIFKAKKSLKKKAPCTILDSVIKANKKYYPQTLLKECKYEQETTKVENLIDDDLDKSESDDSDSDSNDETKSDDESNESFVKKLQKYFNNNKSLIVLCVDNHALLGFYFCQSVQLA